MAESGDSGAAGAGKNLVMNVVNELISSPLNLALLGVCGFLLYKIVSSRKQDKPSPPAEPPTPPLKKQDMSLEQLKQYDGTGDHGRICIAVNNKVFDVTRGKRFYGPGGPYGLFAGRDASRGLATFSLTEEVIKDEWDDLSDLDSMQMDSIREWEMQFTEKYDFIGRLLKPGEEPREYSDTEDDQSTHDSTEKSKDD